MDTIIKNSNKKTIPLLPLRGLLVFPYTVLHFDVGRDKSIGALEHSMMKDQFILLSTQKDARIDFPNPDEIYTTGTIAKVNQILKLPGNTIRVLVEGICRGKIVRYIETEPFLKVEVVEIQEGDCNTEDLEIEALMRSTVSQFKEYIKLNKRTSPEVMITVDTINEPGKLADIIASHMSMKIEQKQEILEITNGKSRLMRLYEILTQEIEILEIERRISQRVKKQMEKNQKEYYLREQLKAIQKELGDKNEKEEEVEEYRKKIYNSKLPPDLEEKVLKEVYRLEKMPEGTAEGSVIRTYLDWILNLPWSHETSDRLDIVAAEKILDEDHYGLENVKERILEYLAVRQLTKNMKGPILCLVGPPGVGKTSLAKSVARALGRKFVRISLGGVRDEAEIRGHRRTYVGALPGRIIQGIKQAGTKNPVFLLDEIDKTSSDFRGDPADALLEVLDPEQNSNFSDHYIEQPFDLSKVMFITTANSSHNIPRPLLDRMEIINITGYTEEEKVKIAEKYLIPKQIKEHGLKKDNLLITEGTIRNIVRYYTREAGVRNLEREIAAICRKAARSILKENKTQIKVTTRNLNKFLGMPRYRYGEKEKEHEIGVATGMAWTESGGDILSIEATIMPGKGKITLTGKLGDVMQESAYAGISYIRSQADKYHLEEHFYEKNDIHIHVPEGAIPKDGPSAGITMATAIISALTNTPINKNVAMTGEITLRGRVLAVGGIKEKVLAAHRAGIKTIILPKDNKSDLEEIPSNIKRKLDFVFVDNMEQVLEKALKGTKNED
ncbi:MAG TPA: endopeptidase La [Thermoanaerobacterales bacterium]|nr:endopeptidase La [Thermoanaerobacterales bacterium]